MKIVCGCDLLDTTRADAPWLNAANLEKIYHPTELAHTTSEQRAGTFALKEAAIKAFGLRPGDWLRITVLRQKSGKPTLAVEGAEATSIDCSISHDGGLLVAMVVALI